jgi:superfamily I DNA/RNA helicase
MATWLLHRSELTPDQLAVVEAPPTENRLVLGPPGSGKTQVLVHRAAHLSEAYKVPPSRFRAFVFTNVIREYIRSGFEFLGLPDGSVSTLDYWTTAIYEEHVSRRLPRKRDGKTPDFGLIRRNAREVIEESRRLRGSLDFVLVDEGQDLSPEVYEILRLAARHVTVFVDPLQKIFEGGADESFIRAMLGLEARQVSLLGAYRNAPYVAQLASHFIADDDSRARYLAQVHAEQKIRERPLLYVAPNFPRELDRMAEIVRQRQVLNERIGIIVPTNRYLHGIARGLEERGVKVERAVTNEEGGKIKVYCDFGNLVPKIATFFMAKGLTFDSVVLPRLTEHAYQWTKPRQRGRMLFVGIARATQWVYLSTVRDAEFAEIEVLRGAAAQGHLTIQEDAGADAGMGMGDSRRGSADDDGFAPRDSRTPPDSEDDEFSVL